LHGSGAAGVTMGFDTELLRRAHERMCANRRPRRISEAC
jgi:hypothetical protein